MSIQLGISLDRPSFGAAVKAGGEVIDTLHAKAERARSAVGRWRAEIDQAAMSRANAARAQLPLEVRINALLEKRRAIQAAIAKVGDDQYRRTALMVALERNRASTAHLQGQQPQSSGPAPVGFLRGLGVQLAGFVSLQYLGTRVMQMTGELIANASQISNLSKRLDIGVEALQEFTTAAADTGANVEDVADAIQN